MHIYNTLTQKKEKFIPKEKDHVKMYVCGPTVYNEIHVGNARAVLVFDLLYRVFKATFKNVTYVRNITDIDDKIIKKAIEENKKTNEVAKYWEESFKENCKKLNALPPEYEPRATEKIPQIIEAIAQMIEDGFAYEKEGHVYFRISALNEYGCLSKQCNTNAGARIATSENKEADEDFVLWKPSKAGEPYWASVWGSGRPGWHIECTVMSSELLGTSFDLHGGGQDLIFPHHENEQAQNIALYGADAGPKYWMHNAMVLFDGEKMSKSLGNVVRLSEAFAQHNPLIIRFFILSTHYRHPLIWNEENLAMAASRFNRWVYHLQEENIDAKVIPAILEALQNDLNTPEAFAIFDKLLSEALNNKDKDLLARLAATLNLIGCLPILNERDASIRQKLEKRVKEREAARANKDFAQADSIRKEIEEAGYEICDSAAGSFLKKKMIF